MLVLYALLCPDLNSSKITYLKVIEQYLIGNTFANDGEVGEMATPLFKRRAIATTTVSREPFIVEGCATTQNVRNGHFMGGQ